MAKETEEVERTTTKTITRYKCDKCRGRFHEETQWREDLNLVAFDAQAAIDPIPNGTQDAHSHGIPRNRLEVQSENEYLLSDRCCERAYEYLRDFF